MWEINMCKQRILGWVVSGTLCLALAVSGQQVRAATTMPGDYNGDGNVDAADFTVWRDSMGQVSAGLAADGNGDGVVSETDYELWRTQYGRRTPAISAAPEASALAIWLGIGLIGAGVVQFRRHRRTENPRA
jgi:hypothetical protein